MRLINESKSTFVVLLGALALSVLAPGCGDDDDDTTTTSGGKTNAGGSTSGGKSSGGTSSTAGGKNSGGTSATSGGSGNGGTAETTGGEGPVTSGGTHAGGSGNGGSTVINPEGGSAGAVTNPEGGSAGAVTNPEGGSAGAVTNPEGGSAGAETGGSGGEGGAGPSSVVTIATFDNGDITGWSTSVLPNTPANPNPAPAIADVPSTVDGHNAPGAFQTVITFTGYGNASDQYGGETTASGHAFPSAVDWTGKTKLHGWVKVTVPGGVGSNDYLALFGWQLAVNSGTNKFLSQFHAPFTDQLWHEFVVDLAAATTDKYDPTQVKGVSVLIATTNVAATNAPAIPPATTLLIDDVWVE